jgi:hypothetical protein
MALDNRLSTSWIRISCRMIPGSAIALPNARLLLAVDRYAADLGGSAAEDSSFRSSLFP